MENFQDRGVWIRIQSLKNARIRIRLVLRGWIRIRIRFVPRGRIRIRIRSISDRIRNPGYRILLLSLNLSVKLIPESRPAEWLVLQ